MKVYIQPDVAPIKAHVQKAGVDWDPDAIIISIWLCDSQHNPIGDELVDEVAMTQSSTGHYYYPFDTAAVGVGKYYAKVSSTDGAFITVATVRFEIAEW
jgi:hypothetical protein